MAGEIAVSQIEPAVVPEVGCDEESRSGAY
jgi:hypothetical protein